MRALIETVDEPCNDSANHRDPEAFFVDTHMPADQDQDRGHASSCAAKPKAMA
jgi:hypothetical protein